MAIDLELIRSLIQRAEKEAPLKVSPTLPIIDINNPKDKGDTVSISIAVPRDEGDEFKHWRLLADLDFIRVSHSGRPGFGKIENQINGLTAKGEEFVELSRDEGTWIRVIELCKAAGSCTIPSVISELRLEAHSRLVSAKRRKR